MTLEIDGSSLTLEGVAAVAAGRLEARLAASARARIEASRAVVERALQAGSIIYGVTTGFGKLSDTRIERGHIAELQRNLIRSHAAGCGEPLAETEVRAALLVRASSLARGFSGVRVSLVETLLEMLARGVHPVVPSRGSVGASGDLAPAAHLALVLIGEGAAVHRGERLGGAEAMRRAGIPLVELGAKEGLSLLNGTQFMAAVGGLVLQRARALVDAADVAGALSIEVLLGTPAASDPRVQEVRPHPGQASSARNLRRLLEGSAIVESHRECGRIQDAYSLRCIPQVHGAVRDALDHAIVTVEREINSATDNPLVFTEGPDGGAILSGGNFHGAPLGYVFDYAGIALTDLASISERRLERMVNPDLSGLPAFLTPDPGLSSGYMLLQVMAAALVSESKILAHPASVDSIPTSGNKEDHVSMGMTSALKLRAIADAAERVIAAEILAGCQALEFRKPLQPAARTGAAYRLVRSRVPALARDREIAPDVAEVVRMVQSGELTRLVKA